MKKELIEERVVFFLFRVVTVFTIIILFSVFLSLFISGHSVINLNFLTSYWNNSNITHGGIFQAIVGSFYIGVGVTLISFPLGFSSAIFLTHYSKNNLLKRAIQLAIRNLAGVPSVIYGIFGLAVFVNLLSFGTSLLSAILTLAVMTLPWIITTSITSIESIPPTFYESSVALGATKWQTIQRIIIPSSIASAITGGIVSITRALGETAPIIIVGATFYLSDLPTSIFDKFMALPYHAFILSTQHSSPYSKTYAAATALILVMLTFILSFSAILLRYYYQRRKVW